jgi:hypothetical protein
MPSLLKNILKFLIAFLSIVSIYSSDYVVCPDEISACPNGSICCLKTTGDYSCCVNTRICCFDGTKCCLENSIKKFFFGGSNKNNNINKSIIESETTIKNININKNTVSSVKFNNHNSYSKNKKENILENFIKNFEKFKKCIKKFDLLNIDFNVFIQEIKDFNFEKKKGNLFNIESVFNSISINNLIEDLIKIEDEDCREFKNEFIKFKNIIMNYLKDF